MGAGGWIECLGKTEAEDLGLPLWRYHDVVGIDIAVYDALGVGLGQAVRDLDCQIQRTLQSQLLARDQRPQHALRAQTAGAIPDQRPTLV